MSQPAKLRLAERDVIMIGLVAEGKTFAAIGRRLGISEDSATKAFGRVRQFLGALNNAHAVHIAHQLRILTGVPQVNTARSGTLREDEVDLLALTATGLTQNELADRLRTTRHVVNRRHERLRHRLRARNLTHAIAIAYETGQLPAGPRE